MLSNIFHYLKVKVTNFILVDNCEEEGSFLWIPRGVRYGLRPGYLLSCHTRPCTHAGLFNVCLVYGILSVCTSLT